MIPLEDFTPFQQSDTDLTAGAMPDLKNLSLQLGPAPPPTAELEPFPVPQVFCLETGLYSTFEKSSDKAYANWHDLVNKSLHLDCFCNSCGRMRSFWSAGRSRDSPQPYEIRGAVVLEFRCAKDNKHVLSFVLWHTANSVQKIGQWPSAADLAEGELARYKPILGDNFQEFKKGIGLFSHGVGIGSFVYLRRIFERFVLEASVAASVELGDSWNQEDFDRSRMDDKIQIVANYLPRFLVEHRTMYGIMSKGVHQLSEKECLSIFPAVRASIEIILDQKLALKLQKQKEEDAKLELQKVMKSLSGGDGQSTASTTKKI